MNSIIKNELTKEVEQSIIDIKDKEDEIVKLRFDKRNNKRARVELEDKLLEIQDSIMINEADLNELDSKIAKTSKSLACKRQLNQFKKNLLNFYDRITDDIDSGIPETQALEVALGRVPSQSDQELLIIQATQESFLITPTEFTSFVTPKSNPEPNLVPYSLDY